MFRNIGTGWVLTALTIAITFVLLPFVIQKLGEQGYGTWLLVLAITSYLNQLTLGVPMASVRYFAEHVADRDVVKLNETIATCGGLYLVMGLAALVLGGGLFAFFDTAYDVPLDLREPARLAFFMMVVHAAAGYFMMLPYGIMAAHQDLALRYSISIAGLLLRLVLTLVLLSWNPSLVFLAVIQLAVQAFEFITVVLVVRQRYPGVKLAVSGFELRTAKRILSFSAYVILLTAGANLAIAADSLVIGKWLDMEQIAFYAVAGNIAHYLYEFAGSIQHAVMPMATKLKTEGNPHEIRVMYLRWSKISFFLTVPLVAFLVTLGPRFVAWWIDPSFEEPSGSVLRVLMVSVLALLPVYAVAQPILMGSGKPRVPALLILVSGVVNLFLSILLVGPLGLVGVSLGTAIPSVMFALAMMAFTCREVSMSLREYWAYSLSRVAVGSTPVWALLTYLTVAADVTGIVALTAAGFATLILSVVVGLLFVFGGDPLIDAKEELARAWNLLASRADG